MRRWVEEFCRRYGIAYPSQEEVDAILELARIAAHASGSRPAAPVTSYLAGLLASGQEAAERGQMLRQMVADLEGPPGG